MMAMNASVWQFGTISGPIAAGLLHLLGSPAPFVVAALAAGLGAATVLFVPAVIGRAHLSDEPRSATLADALEGVRFILRTPAMLGTMSLDLVAVLLGGATALLPVFSRDVLHVGRARQRPAALGARRGRADRRAPADGAPVQPPRRPDAVPRRRRVRRAHARVRALAQLHPLARRPRGPRCGRHAERVHPLDARPAPDPAGAARPRGRRRARLHRRLERAGRIRVGHGRGADRRRARSRDRRHPGDGGGRVLGLALPAAAPIDAFEDATSSDPSYTCPRVLSPRGRSGRRRRRVHRSSASSKNLRRMRAPSGLAER